MNHSQQPLAGKTALVTGSTSGIGFSVAQALAKQGAHIIINGFGEPGAIDSMMRTLQQKNVKAAYYGADMSKPEEIAHMMQQIESEFGGVDILVNNAGIQFVSPIQDFPAEKWDSILAINLSSAFHTIRLALPSMQKKNWGRIINIASTHGLVASANKSAYVAAKHGIIGLTKVTALENALTGITCNAICPGWVHTPLVQKQIEDRAQKLGMTEEAAKKDLLAEKQPSHEFVQPEQLAALVLFMCSDAANEVRGVAWNMDGGWVAQ